MTIGKVHSWKKMLAQQILIVVPTCVLFFYVLWDLNRFYLILQNDWIKQGAYFATGIVLATFFYSYRFRFITTAGIIILVYYLIYKLLGSSVIGEFDAFYYSVQFLIFVILFSVGWFAGFGFSRSRYFTIFWSIILLAVEIIVVSKTTDVKVNTLIGAFIPVLVYAFYIIYTAELIRNMNEDETSFVKFIFKRMAGFAFVLLVLFLTIFYVFQKDFTAIEKEWGNSQGDYNKEGGGKNSEKMTGTDKDGFTCNKDQTRLTGSLSKDKQLVFVAHLDNFFDDGRTPNPLYFTSCYYTKFDTLTQTFEKDSLMPYNDLFNPSPSKIPLYFTKTDSTVLKNSLATKNRKVITADVYKVILSPNAYLAPSTAFFCQPIGVPKEYRALYKSSYRAKMLVSDLNSAYFVYNPAGNRLLQSFQEARFEKLREIKKITGPDSKFMNYYTFMPRNAEYKKISELAKQITKDAPTPIDKMIAIRDYFLSKDEFNQPLFKYSDNPGIPGLPSANKLTYFLLENRKGYCAYFAGATLFMLRSLGIPSRVTAGFLTVDRSSKNPGWYWFYQDQAHAWVQVYFQGYGWIDFDTTVPDVNTHQSPQPDGTPPLNMPQTYLVADGDVESVDVKAKQIKMEVHKMLYHDKDYDTPVAEELTADVSIATITADTGTVKLDDVKKGMHITAVSYSEVLKNIIPDKNDKMEDIITKLPKPVPIDEVKVISTEEYLKQLKKADEKKAEPIHWIRLMINILIGIAAFIILLFMLPWLIWQYMNLKAKTAKKDKAFYIYRASLYYLNQLGYFRSNQGPQQYAELIDNLFSTKFVSFSNVYQKTKYSSAALTDAEWQTANEFYKPFIHKIKKKTKVRTRFSKFLNIYNTINYFSQPKIN